MKVLVAGDFYPQAQAAKKLNEGDFASVLGEISPMIKESDFSVKSRILFYSFGIALISADFTSPFSNCSSA